MENYYTSKYVSKTDTSLFLIALGILTFISLLSYLSRDFDVFPFSFEMLFKDYAIRGFICTHFFLILSLFVLFIIEIISGFLQGFFVWFFSIKRKIYKYNPKLEKLSDKIFYKEMISPLSLSTYAVVVIMLYLLLPTIDLDSNPFDFWLMILFSISILILVLGYNLFVSRYKACKKLGLNFQEAMKKCDFLFASFFTSNLPSITIFVFLLVKTFRISTVPLFKMTIGSSILVSSKITSFSHSVYDTLLAFQTFFERVFSWQSIYIIFYFSVFVILIYYYFSYSKYVFKNSRKRKNRYIMDLLIFLFIFFVTQGPLFWATGTINLSFLFISLVVALTVGIMGRSFETMMKHTN